MYLCNHAFFNSPSGWPSATVVLIPVIPCSCVRRCFFHLVVQLFYVFYHEYDKRNDDFDVKCQQVRNQTEAKKPLRLQSEKGQGSYNLPSSYSTSEFILPSWRIITSKGFLSKVSICLSVSLPSNTKIRSSSYFIFIEESFVEEQSNEATAISPYI